MSENKELEDVYGDKYPVLVFQTSLQKIQRYKGKKKQLGEKKIIPYTPSIWTSSLFRKCL